MKKNILLFIGTLLLSVLLFGWMEQSAQPEQAATERAKQQFTRDLEAFEQLLVSRLLPLAEKGTDTKALQQTFLLCRQGYKKLEHFTEYYAPGTSRLLNGAPLDEIEVEETKSFEPAGLQVVEELVYAEEGELDKAELIRQIKNLRNQVARIRTVWSVTELTDAHLFDALRLQVFRVITLGISGFDTPICKTAMTEAATSLASLRTYATYYPKNAETNTLNQLFEQAETYLTQHADFDTFDRAIFIRTLANPLTTKLLAYQKSLDIQPFNEARVLRADAATLFDSAVFNPDFYAPHADMRTNRWKVMLGEKLFFDPILSHNNSRSCASCHQPDRAFTDGLPKAATLTGKGAGLRNTPTILNAALQNGQFYDLRSQTLENQSLDVVHNIDEMHGSLDEAALKLQRLKEYMSLFQQAFPRFKGNVEPVQIQNALAAYERSLVRLNSRFDRYMRGEEKAMTLEEISGFNLFMGKAKCGICHFMPVFNGTIPPNFAKTESEVIGVPASSKVNAATGRHEIDGDLGRYALTKLDPLKYAFKTPTVRNTELTAPYMHNGVFKKLDEVVDFYDKGGGSGLKIALSNQTLPEDNLNLSAQEKEAIIAFMKALTDAPVQPSKGALASLTFSK
ncbi:cytochrome-c peroxidase [Tellurirhabdus bombi]|uniref:cytochrome-c peroxidase n=1 Tax=Tellurirhabdus bombi TaxID=2907205 RepID=UPI001F19E162|nr:cytochrome c peroxidase [Tellurirhabdus bombi]